MRRLYLQIYVAFLCILGLLADVFFIAWGISALSRRDLRVLPAQRYQPITTGPPAAAAQATPTLPPIIAG